MSSTPGIVPVKKHQFLFGDAAFDIAYILQDKVFTKPTAERDGIHIEGTDYSKPVLVTNCTVDFSDCTEETDELVSVVHGGIVIFDHCTFRCGRKAALIGTGDKGEIGSKAFFVDCEFSDFGRRGPEVQSHSLVRMKNCTIRNWGSSKFFDTRNFAAWVHDGGYLCIDSCTFIQHNSVFNHLFEDVGNHIGNMFNEGRRNGSILKGILYCMRHPIHCLLPGVWRGAICDDSDSILICLNCDTKGIVYLQRNAGF